MTHILRLPAVKELTGYSRSTIYLYMESGLFPKPIKIGSRSVGWPSGEVFTIIKARVSGKTSEEIQILVREIEQSRSGQ